MQLVPCLHEHPFHKHDRLPTGRSIIITMFSPAVADSGHGTAMKSRRRQRPLSSENLMLQPKAKRQRLPLSEQTFVSPDAPPQMLEVKADKAAKLPAKLERLRDTTPAAKQDLSVRSKKPKPGERVSKGDGSVVLVSFPSRCYHAPCREDHQPLLRP